MKLNKIILLLFFITNSSFSQVKKWTLEECINYALENNITIKQSELDLKSANVEKREAIGDLMPDLNSNISYSGNSGLVLDQSRNKQVLGTIKTGNLSANSSINIFNGLKSINRIRRANINFISNQYKLENIKDDIKIEIINAYLQILANKESLKISKAQFSVVNQDLQKTKELVEVGRLAEGDLLEIEATMLNQKQQIVNNRNNVLISLISLAQLLQIDDYENFDIKKQDFIVPLPTILNNSSKDIFNKAVTFRNDIKLAETNIDISKKDLLITKGDIYPTLSAFFNYSTRYSSENRDNRTLNVYSFVDQLYMTDGISYGLQLRIPIFNKLSVRNRISRNKIQVKKLELQLKQTKLNLENTINKAYLDVKNLYEIYQATEKTLSARKLAYEYSKEKFNVGLMNSFDFSQSKSRLDNAEYEVVRSKYNYIFRVKILEFYFGLPIK